jgi:segregation and condensation protein A
MDVCDVPVARITDMFLRRGAAALPSWTLEEATFFLSVCALLLEMKVGRLLPRRLPEVDEELQGSASPDVVYARSLELAAFRRVSTQLAEHIERADLSASRLLGIPPEFDDVYPDLFERVTPAILAAVAVDLLRAPAGVDLSHITPLRVSLSDAIVALRGELSLKQETRFSELLADCEERIEIVVRFLALLELYRQGEIEVAQSGPLRDIEIRWRERAPSNSPVPEGTT